MLKERLKLIRNRFPRSSTVMFVPHSQQSTYSVGIPFGVMVVFIIFLVLLTMLVVYSSIKYLHMKENMHELNELRTINRQQDRQLHRMEAEVGELRAKMTEVKLLEQDVRELLDSEAFAGRPAARRENVSTSRGGGREPDIVERSSNPVLRLLNREPTFRERKARWDQGYHETRNRAGEMLAGVDAVRDNLVIMKQEVAGLKDYLECKPAGYPADGKISSGFGLRRSPFSGRPDEHPAVDIAADYGTAVVATGKGVVVFAGYRAGYGKTVEIEHGYGFKTVYCHNSAITVETGRRVERGDLIARVGNSGVSTGPHLHYEVVLNGVRVDPAPYMHEHGGAAAGKTLVAVNQ